MNLKGIDAFVKILSQWRRKDGKNLDPYMCEASSSHLKKRVPFTICMYLHFSHFFSDLLHCTEEPNVSIPTLANLLIERTQSQNWITVFKGLVTLHHMMCYGNERFIQYLGPDFV